MHFSGTMPYIMSDSYKLIHLQRYISVICRRICRRFGPKSPTFQVLLLSLGWGGVDNCIRVVYLMNMTNVSFLERFLCFLMGNWSMILSISYCRKFQHLVVVLSLSMLFQSSFVKYFLTSLCLPLWKFILYFLFALSDFTLMSKCI